ncbi:MAG: hypothetical protein ACYCOR_04260 [Acidobacteriaceae bacterium]
MEPDKTDTVSDPDRSSSPQPSQTAVYRRYAQLQAIRSERFPEAAADGLAGRLIACVGFGLEGAELALATTISGGTFLGIDPSSDRLKAAVRNGSCDFMVNTLDESLRVLKNEIRKRKALSVGLLGEASTILPAMVERGVQPDLVAETAASDSVAMGSLDRPALLQLIERGAGRLDMPAAKHSSSAGLVEVVWTAESFADLKRMDMLALEQLPPDDTIGRRWLRQAPGCFHRQRPLQRILDLRPEELTRLLRTFQDAISAGKIQSPATLHWRTAEGAKQSIAL